MKIKELIKTEHEKYDSSLELAAGIGVKHNTVKTYCSKLGIRFKGSGSSVQKYVKVNPFGLDRTSWYWLGWVASDGNISSSNNMISITSKDIDLLNRIKELDNEIRIYVKPNGIGVAYFSNPESKKYLQSLGITPKKSLTLEMKCQLNWDFIRGLFDGDGSVRVRDTIEIHITTGSKKLAEQLHFFFQEEGIISTIRLKDRRFNGCYGVYVSAKSAVLFHEKMYYNTDLFLERKKSIMCHYVERRSEKSRELLENPTGTISSQAT